MDYFEQRRFDALERAYLEPREPKRVDDCPLWDDLEYEEFKEDLTHV